MPLKIKAKWILFLCIFLLTSFVCNTASAQKKAIRYYKDGIDKMEEGNYKEAITFFENAISIKPEPKRQKLKIGMMSYDYDPETKLRECKAKLGVTRVTSIPTTILPKKPSNPYKRSYAVVIGIDDYENWPGLKYGVNSALAVSRKLKGLGFKVITILDREAVKERVINEQFHKLVQNTSRNDRVIIYFAGLVHTEKLSDGGKKGYLITADTPSSEFKSEAITIDRIRDFSSNIPAKHKLYVMDTCFSDDGMNSLSKRPLKSGGDLEEMVKSDVVQFVAAGNSRDHIQLRNDKGLFTTYFLKALNGEADGNKDGIVTVTELGKYLRDMVSTESQHKQTPLGGRWEGEGEFILVQ